MSVTDYVFHTRLSHPTSGLAALIKTQASAQPAARCPLSAGPAVPCPRVRPHCPLLSLSAGPATPCPLIPLRCPLVSSSAGTAYCPSRCPLARCLLVLLSAGVAVAGVADR
ncbi:hypothetical protein PC116_g9805 [Phytophthora cactorum]|nr:hypothetical protein C6341_g13286 [Phytophthora cactorum]KAG4242263.1 hypothetical protein PC116_g9805 [Phytophthora cactorum]